jgi:hypothetical protein
MMIPILILVAATFIAGILIARSRATRGLGGPEMAAIIDDFIEGRRGDWEWEETWQRPGNSMGLDAFKDLVANVPKEYPPDAPGVLCSPAGFARLRALRDRLRQAAT